MRNIKLCISGLIFIVLPYFAWSNTFILDTLSTNDNMEEEEETIPAKKLPVIGLGAGLMTFYGDIKEKSIGDPNSYRYGFAFNVMQPLSSGFGINLSALYGKLAGNQMSTRLNFESKVTGIGLGVAYSFDNGLILKKNSRIAPYISLGGQFNLLKTFKDSLDNNGKIYYYWTDGSIKDKGESDPDADNAKQLQRDYVYETPMVSSSAISFPAGIGIRFKISDQFNVNLGVEYHMTLSDNIDAKEEGGVDKYTFTSVSLHYNLYTPKKIDKNEFRYMQVDFLALDAKDTDNDGVIDFKDVCPTTPKGILVDKHGCPIDDDKDGVANYLDKQANTRKGAIVNANGVELTGSESPEILAQYLKPDSLAFSNTSANGEYIISNMAINDSIVIKNAGSKETIFSSRIGYQDNLIVPLIEGTNPYFIITNVSKSETWLVSNFKTGDTLTTISIYKEQFSMREASQTQSVATTTSEKPITSEEKTEPKPVETTKPLEEAKTELSVEKQQASTTTNTIPETAVKEEAKKEESKAIQAKQESSSKTKLPEDHKTSSAGSSPQTSTTATETAKTEEKLSGTSEKPIPQTQEAKTEKESPATVDTENITEDTLIVSKFPDEELKELPVIRDNIFPNKGLYYGVDIGAFRYRIPESFFSRLRIKNVTTEPAPDNKTDYIIGVFEKYADASLMQKDFKYIGFTDAIIVAYFDGKKIPLKEAKAIAKK